MYELYHDGRRSLRIDSFACHRRCSASWSVRNTLGIGLRRKASNSACGIRGRFFNPIP